MKTPIIAIGAIAIFLAGCSEVTLPEKGITKEQCESIKALGDSYAKKRNEEFERGGRPQRPDSKTLTYVDYAKGGSPKVAFYDGKCYRVAVYQAGERAEEIEKNDWEQMKEDFREFDLWKRVSEAEKKQTCKERAISGEDYPAGWYGCTFGSEYYKKNFTK